MRYYLVDTKFNYGEHEYTTQVLLVCHESDEPKERLYARHYAEMFGEDTRREDKEYGVTFWRDDDWAYCCLYGITQIPKSDFMVLKKYISVIEAPMKNEKVTF